MTVTKNERLSAMVDDEADAFETRRLLDELDRNPEDLALWERYHLIGDAIRGGARRSAAPGFSAGVMARIAHEPALSAPASMAGRALGRRLAKPAAGLAMAASVAVAILVGIVNLTGAPDAEMPAVAERGDAASVPLPIQGVVRVAEGEPVIAPATRESRMAVPMEAPDARLNSFIVNHAEHAAGRGLMPYVRVVGYETPAK